MDVLGGQHAARVIAFAVAVGPQELGAEFFPSWPWGADLDRSPLSDRHIELHCTASAL
jgi:hypothetical protein